MTPSSRELIEGGLILLLKAVKAGDSKEEIIWRIEEELRQVRRCVTAQSTAQPLLLAVTISSSDRTITIECNDVETRHKLHDWLESVVPSTDSGDSFANGLTWQEYWKIRNEMTETVTSTPRPISGSESCTCHFIGDGTHHVDGCNQGEWTQELSDDERIEIAERSLERGEK